MRLSASARRGCRSAAYLVIVFAIRCRNAHVRAHHVSSSPVVEKNRDRSRSAFVVFAIRDRYRLSREGQMTMRSLIVMSLFLVGCAVSPSHNGGDDTVGAGGGGGGRRRGPPPPLRP